MKKRTWLITIILLFLLFFLGIGVKKQMNKEAQKREIHEAEKVIVQDVVKNYLDIRKIDFTTIEYTSATGAYEIYFKINNSSTEFFYTYFNSSDFDSSGSEEADISSFFKHRTNDINYQEDYSRVKVTYHHKLEE